MRYLSAAVTLIVAALLLGACKSGGTTEPENGNAKQLMVQRHNDTRADAGVDALSENSLLSAIAQDHADYMASQDTLSHVDSQGRHVDERALAAGYNWGAIGENIGYNMSASALYEAWLGSSGHYNNITDASYDEIGVGVAYVDNYQYWCIVFGAQQ